MTDHPKPTQRRVVRNRARGRAVTALIRRHEQEWREVYAAAVAAAEAEAEEIAQTDDAREHYATEPVRLKRGRRKDGQKAGDRIDVARCPHCITHHDRGHVCRECGTAPHELRWRNGPGGVKRPSA